MSELNTRKGVTRRTIAKGAAWTVPAIAVAGAAPAMAASPPEEPPGEATLTGHSCKLPGAAAAPYTDGSVYTAVISNTTDAPLNFEITSFTRAGVTQPGANVAVIKLSSEPAGSCCVNLGNEFTVPANSTGTFALVTQGWGSSGSGALSVGYNVDDEPQTPATGGDGGNGPIPGNCDGDGGSCSLTNAQKACILQAVMPECTSGNCS